MTGRNVVPPVDLGQRKDARVSLDLKVVSSSHTSGVGLRKNTNL